MSRLLNEIISEIENKGPMTVDRYMELCNSHYYATRDPLGNKGDFITAPEISQIFGEMIGIWAITAWQKIGSPEKCALVELGPGRGTLMADILRVIKGNFSAEVHLVETSPSLREIQAAKLGNIFWHDKLPDLNIPYILIANEFFDALPFKQFVSGKERKIIAKDGKLSFDLIAEDGLVTESCPIGSEIMKKIASSASAAVIIDYGYVANEKRSTLQAVKDHKYHSFLENPGEADLTALVDFSEMANITKSQGKNCTILTQREFLLAHGADIRAKILNKEKDLERLIAPEQMGELFKVLCF